MPEFSVTVTPYEREGSNIKGLARIYFENSFIVNNINIVQGKEKIFVSMPSYNLLIGKCFSCFHIHSVSSIL